MLLSHALGQAPGQDRLFVSRRQVSQCVGEGMSSEVAGRRRRRASGGATSRSSRCTASADPPTDADGATFSTVTVSVPVIGRVVGGGQAYRLKLGAGDVLWKYDGEEIANRVRLLHRRVGEKTPRVPIVLRGGEPFKVVVRSGLFGTNLSVRVVPAAAKP